MTAIIEFLFIRTILPVRTETARRRTDFFIVKEYHRKPYDYISRHCQENNLIPSFEVLRSRINSGWYDPALLETFSKTSMKTRKFKRKTVTIEQLNESMIFTDGIVYEDTKVIAGHKGQVVTKALRMTLLNFKRGGHLGDAVSVIIPVDEMINA
jgi:hypothetical protein